MTSTDAFFSVMFADVAGSTRLYEALGDTDAKALIDELVATMTRLTDAHGGILVKTIGDEVMSRFTNASDAITAACAIQEAIGGMPSPREGARLAVRIGVHWGPAILDNGDLFGDAVNVAARLTEIARARQIIISGDTVNQLPAALRDRARLLDRTAVKGRQAEVSIHELLWEQRKDVTALMPLESGLIRAISLSSLTLRCGAQERQVPADGSGFVIGRAEDSHLVVPGTLTSRQHARIEFRRGKFMLTDQSTNGTWVRQEDGNDIYLRREEIPLWGSGLISLGEALDPGSATLVTYTARY